MGKMVDGECMIVSVGESGFGVKLMRVSSYSVAASGTLS
jgi:hypothetical protein